MQAEAFVLTVAGQPLARRSIDNLAALHVERLETEVASDNIELLRFLYRFGIGGSQRLLHSHDQRDLEPCPNGRTAHHNV